MSDEEKFKIAIAAAAGILVVFGIEKVKTFLSDPFGLFSGAEDTAAAVGNAVSATNPDGTEDTASIFDLGNLID